MKKIAVFISGSGTNLQSLIDAINIGKINGEIVLVCSNRKNAYGLIRAKDNNIDTLYLSKFNFSNDTEYDKFLLNELQKRKVDLVVLAGYLRIFTKEFVAEYKNRIINIHPSLIPSFCGDGFYGENVHKAVIDSGVKVTGATTHFVDENIDTGSIILQGITFIDKNDDCNSISKKVLEIEHKILVSTIQAFCDDRIIFVDGKAFVKED